jgi:hypothetical protein
MSNAFQGNGEDLETLLSPATIRARAAAMLDLAERGGTSFALHLEKLEEVAAFVSAVTLANYPTLDIPFHSRWNHFQAGGRDRNAELNGRLMGLDGPAVARAKLDLAIVSVLLDAGAGMAWRYREGDSDLESSRSEGLAVASWNMFTSGLFSSDPEHPLRVDAAGLDRLDPAALAEAFQVTGVNPLVGLEGRYALLKALALALKANPALFGVSEVRPGRIFDHFQGLAAGKALRAPQVLRALQQGLGTIWPGRLALATAEGEINLGDAWHYPPWSATPSMDSIIPFHKLSQWLSYSLLEPLMEAGLDVTDIDGLTGLAEYRNGGLMLDSGLLELRDPTLVSRSHSPASNLIIEWRALTLALLDGLAEPVRAQLGNRAEHFPLAKILEGGTWWAGRKLAAERRPDGAPPLRIDSDGTVF